MNTKQKLISVAITAAVSTVLSPAALAVITVNDPDGDTTRVSAPRIAPGQTVQGEAITLTYFSAFDVIDTPTEPTTFYVDAPTGTTFVGEVRASTNIGILFFDDGEGGISQDIAGVMNSARTRVTWTIQNAPASGTINISAPMLNLDQDTKVSQVIESTTNAVNYNINDLYYTVALAPTGVGATPGIDTDNVAAVKIATNAPQQVIENVLASGVPADYISGVNVEVPTTMAFGSPDIQPVSLLIRIPEGIRNIPQTITLTAPTTVAFDGGFTAPTATVLNGSGLTVNGVSASGNVITATITGGDPGPGGQTASQLKIDIAGFSTDEASFGPLPVAIAGTVGISNPGLNIATVVNAGTSLSLINPDTPLNNLTKGAQNSQFFSTFTITESFGNVIKAGTFEVIAPAGIAFSSANAVSNAIGPGLGVTSALSSDGRILTVTTSGADIINSAGKINISGTVRVADAHQPTTLPLTIRNIDAGVSNGTIVVANITNPSVTLSSGGTDPSNIKVVGSGVQNQLLDTLQITEVSSGSIQVPGEVGQGGIGTIILSAPAGVTITSATANVFGTGLTLNSLVGFVSDDGTSATFNVTGETTAEPGILNINLAADISNTVAPGTDITFMLGGTAGVSGTVTLATVDTSTATSSSDLTDIAPGPTAQLGGKVSIVENFPYALTSGTFRLVMQSGASFAQSGHVVTGPIAVSTVTTALNTNDTLEIILTPTLNLDSMTIVPNMFVSDSIPDQSFVTARIIDGDAAGSENQRTGITSDRVDIAFNGTSTPLSVSGNVDVNVGFTASTPVEGTGAITASSGDATIATADVVGGKVVIRGVAPGIATITLTDERTSTTFEAIVGEPAQPPASEKVATTGGGESSAGFAAGVTRDGGNTFENAFGSLDDISLVVTVNPEPEDIAKLGEIFIAMKSVTTAGVSFSYLNLDSELEDWDLTVGGLGAAAVVELAESHTLNFDVGPLDAGTHKVYLGYAFDGGDLIYTPKALTITVSED